MCWSWRGRHVPLLIFALGYSLVSILVHSPALHLTIFSSFYRYDLSYDLRDRARFATALLGLVPATLDPSLADSHALGRLRAAAEKVALSSKLPPVNLL